MADFCKACSLEVFGVDTGDLAGLTKPEDWKNNLADTALCEGCGPIQVDPEGNCVSERCFRQGQPGHGLPWIGEEG